MALDGSVLSIDDAANEAVYGRDTTPRMIFEGRAAGQPSSAVVDFRDRLEEATTLARSNRGTGQGHTASAAPVTPAAPVIDTRPLDAGNASTAGSASPTAFEPVEDSPVIAEPLPDTLPEPLPEPGW